MVIENEISGQISKCAIEAPKIGGFGLRDFDTPRANTDVYA